MKGSEDRSKADLKPVDCLVASVHLGFHVLLFANLVTASTPSPIQKVRLHYLMGTRITIAAEGAPEVVNRALDEAYSELHRVDQVLSTYRPDSEITRLNRHGGGSSITVSPLTARVIEEALRLAENSEGAFDPTVGPLVRLWGFGDDSAISTPSPDRLTATLAQVGFRHVEFNRQNRSITLRGNGVALDLGGIAKGYAVDRAVAALKRAGVERGLIDLGESSIGVLEWRQTFVIRHPMRADAWVATFEIENGAISTSASYEKGFEVDGQSYSHILDPRTGWPVQKSLSATVLGREGEAMKADGLSTAGFVMGPEGAVELWRRMGVEGILFFRNGNQIDFTATNGFPLVELALDPAESDPAGSITSR